MAQQSPHEKTYWVAEGKLLAGSVPVTRYDAKLIVKRLFEGGIRTIINLMEENERNNDGDLFLPYQGEWYKLGRRSGKEVHYLRIPIRDMDVPPPFRIETILRTLDDSIAAGFPVYVHCWGGRGRTGLIVGCWLARHGATSGDAALARIAELRKDIDDKQSPETPEQCEMVRNWK